jgi:hypothetical protein
MRRLIALPITCVAILCCLQRMSSAEGTSQEVSHACCGCKVCKLVCEQKKLTVTCYGCKCKDICIPGRSQDGCKHCATCSGGSAAKCGECPPKCEFCWRDWCPCGCAEPRTIHVLTKYQAEKKIAWYHWEVVDGGTLDANCCQCITDTRDGDTKNDRAATANRTVYKIAPDGVRLGDTFEVTREERSKLAAMFETISGDDLENTRRDARSR